MRSVPLHEGLEGGEEGVDAEQKDVDVDDVDEDATATGRPQLSHFTRPAGQSLRQACLKECHSDTSCPILHQKCCHYGCNSVCSEVSHWSSSTGPGIELEKVK
ncbi:unnamed protein product [Dibothriocephalus latus]|uniref:WAP domain-containing protein n=1 Tax=Dibothriocephalus latus TaxID=60516 RepID=A0A3P7RRZ5_DIBLA|nr:unnamed protein product [Dibothriocephalus latus]